MVILIKLFIDCLMYYIDGGLPEKKSDHVDTRFPISTELIVHSESAHRPFESESTPPRQIMHFRRGRSREQPRDSEIPGVRLVVNRQDVSDNRGRSGRLMPYVWSLSRARRRTTCAERRRLRLCASNAAAFRLIRPP